MVDSVLLSGWLSGVEIAKAFSEIEGLANSGQDKISLLIKSDGGDAIAAIGFIKMCRELVERTQLKLQIKIYNAKSAAGLIAISLGSYREMSAQAELALHTASATDLRRSDFVKDWVLNKGMQLAFEQFDQLQEEAMAKLGIFTLYKNILLSDQLLKIPGQKCLGLGIVNRLF